MNVKTAAAMAAIAMCVALAPPMHVDALAQTGLTPSQARHATSGPGTLRSTSSRPLGNNGHYQSAGRATAAATPDPGAVNLKLADLPAGYRVEFSATYATANSTQANAGVESGDGLAITQENRLGRLRTSHIFISSKRPMGVLYIVDSTVVLYKDAPAAHAAFGRALPAMRHALLPAQNGAHPRAITVALVGVERQAWTIERMKAYGTYFTEDLVLFDRGPYLAIIGVGGFSSTFRAGATLGVQLMRTVDGRMQSHR